MVNYARRKNLNCVVADLAYRLRFLKQTKRPQTVQHASLSPAPTYLTSQFTAIMKITVFKESCDRKNTKQKASNKHTITKADLGKPTLSIQIY